MTDNTYNGWTNYETWRVKLEMIEKFASVEHLAPEFDRRDLKEYCTDLLDEEFKTLEHVPVQRFGRDYAYAFLDAVNWAEIERALQTDYIAEDMALDYEDEPEPGKEYKLTGGTGEACIANGSTWKESEKC